MTATETICEACGSAVRAGFRFCLDCGASVEAHEVRPLATTSSIEADPFSTPFEADPADSTLDGPRAGGPRIWLMVVMFALGASSGFALRALLEPPPAAGTELARRIEPETETTPSDGPPSETTAALEMEEPRSETALDGSAETAPADGQADTEPTPVQPDATNDALAIETAGTPAASSAELTQRRADVALISALARTVVSVAQARASSGPRAHAAISRAHQAAAEASRRLPAGLLQAAGARADAARFTGLGAATLAAGDVDESGRVLEAIVLPSGLDLPSLEDVIDRRDRTVSTLAEIDRQLGRNECGTAEDLAEDLADALPGFADHFAGAIRACERRVERQRGRPPRTLE